MPYFMLAYSAQCDENMQSSHETRVEEVLKGIEANTSVAFEKYMIVACLAVIMISKMDVSSSSSSCSL